MNPGNSGPELVRWYRPLQAVGRWYGLLVIVNPDGCLAFLVSAAVEVVDAPLAD